MNLNLKLNSIFGKIMFSYLIIILIALSVLGVLLIYLIQHYFFGVREWEIYQESRKATALLKEPLYKDDISSVESTADTLAHSLETKIRVLDKKGNPIVTAEPDADNNPDANNNRDPIELGFKASDIEHVLKGNTLTKKSRGPGGERLLFAVPVFEQDDEAQTKNTVHEGEVDKEENTEEEEENTEKEEENINEEENPEEENRRIAGIIALSTPFTGIENTIARISGLIFYSAFVAVIISGIIAFSLSNKILKPLTAISNGTKELGKGNFGHRVQINSDDEFGQIANTFNYAAEEIEKTINEQKKLARLRKNLVANVSHEFRTPLSSIRASAELISDGIIKGEAQQRYLQLILDNALHLNRMVTDLTQLSEIESGHAAVQNEKINPIEIASWSYKCMIPEAKKKDIDLSLSYDNNIPDLFSDKDKIQQILRNILENAIQYTPEGGVIKLRVNSSEDHVIFEVEDNGPGIPKEEQNHIWERFYKVNNKKESYGSGLGLAITKQLIGLLNGTIDLKSEVGRGSTFRIEIPSA